MRKHMEKTILDFCQRVAKGIATSFGRNCEVTIHDLTGEDMKSTIVVIENGHVTGRKVGDGIAPNMLARITNAAEELDDQIVFLVREPDGRLIKSTGIILRFDDGRPRAALVINYDITMLSAFECYLEELTLTTADDKPLPPNETPNVSRLLDELIEQSVNVVGKPVALMNKQDKVKAIGFLDSCGAFLITKSGQRVCDFYGISKYTLYSYLDEAKKLSQEEAREKDTSKQ